MTNDEPQNRRMTKEGIAWNWKDGTMEQWNDGMEPNK
jgi:hypothetical protein